MSIVHCAISGIKFNTPHLDCINLEHTDGYYHPVFAASYKSLYEAYGKHCKGKLSSTDSYLIFLAFLHNSEKITWNSPVSLNPASSITSKLVENNISKLVTVLEKTWMIKHPSFIQPEFSVNYENSDLSQITNWIGAWEDNIDYFYSGIASRKEQEDLQKLENRLTSHILSGAKPEQYAAVIASWASRAAEFPLDKDENWKTIIRTCFNKHKMFSTPLDSIKEVAEYCHCNIEVGSIHFHELCKVLDAGIKNHINYLGIASPVSDFDLLPSTVSIDLLNTIITNAPAKTPREIDYKSKLDYIKAKLAYRAAKNRS